MADRFLGPLLQYFPIPLFQCLLTPHRCEALSRIKFDLLSLNFPEIVLSFTLSPIELMVRNY